MSFTKSSTSILIFSALHFSIRLALKNRKKIDEMRNLCDMSAFISRMSLVYSLNLSNVSWFSRKLHAHSTMYSEVLFIFKVCRSLMCKTQLNTSMMFRLSMNATYLILQPHTVWIWSTSRFNVEIMNYLHLALIWASDSMWWVSAILLNLLVMIDFKALLMISSRAMSRYVFKSV